MIVRLIKEKNEVYDCSFSKEVEISVVIEEVNKVKSTEAFLGGYLLDYSFSELELEKILKELTEGINLPFFKFEADVDLMDQLSQAQQDYEWILSYFDYPKGKEEYSIESLLTVGNGFLGLRGTTPEMSISNNNYPGTYAAGVFNTVESYVGETIITNEDFVNLPNAQRMYLVVDGETINLEDNQLNYLKRELDLRTGELTSLSKISFGSGKIVELCSKKIVSMAQRHYFGIDYSFKFNFEPEEVYLISEIDGSVYNYNVERYRKLSNQHLRVLKVTGDKFRSSMLVETLDSNISIYQESELKNRSASIKEVEELVEENKIGQKLTIDPVIDKWATIEKIVYFDKGDIKYPEESSFPSYSSLQKESAEEWADLWKESRIQVGGDLMSQKMLNLHTYHILASASPKGNQGLDASIGARGLHGEAYRGHIFWDELFILPFYINHFPDTAKQLLMYRYERLEMAKHLAEEEGYQGAMYPWQSGLDGSEQSQKLHLNPLTGEWKEDHSRRQRHVSLAIAYNIWQYYIQTNDVDFLADYGLEMLTEIATFWLSISEWNEDIKRYEIKGVMGPDEFHEAYSDREEGGLDNNAYTNLMVSWLFECLIELNETTDLEVKLDLPHLVQVRKNLKLDINSEGVIAQFDGYFDLKEIDWDFYQEKYGNIYRMDRILNAEGESADDYKVAKQADSLMIFYNLPAEKVTDLIENLGYKIPKDYIEKNLLYYLERTSHGSTLSRVVHCQLAEMIDDRELAWKLYQEALYSDYNDIQGGTTAEGIHTGVMAATLGITLSSFAGLDLRDGKEVKFNPHLPSEWTDLLFQFKKGTYQFKVVLTHKELFIEVNEACDVKVGNRIVSLTPEVVNQISY